MPRKAAGLTAVKVRTARPGRYGDGKGLYLLVRSANARFWLFRYRRDRRMREMGLGSVGEVSLAEARDKAEKFHRMVKGGTDPLAEREARAAAEKAAAHQTVVRAITFADVANNYLAAHGPGWRHRKHRQQWRDSLNTHAASILGPLPVAEVDTGAVMRVLEPVWRQKTETAFRLRGRIEAVLDYATARGWRGGENPARWRGHLDNLLPARGKIAKVEHHAALPWREIGGFMAVLAQQEGVAGLALRFAVLTAARTGEAIGATWREIDMAGAVWIVPAGRTKASREHRVPLSDAALDALRSKPRSYAGPRHRTRRYSPAESPARGCPIWPCWRCCGAWTGAI